MLLEYYWYEVANKSSVNVLTVSSTSVFIAKE